MKLSIRIVVLLIAALSVVACGKEKSEKDISAEFQKKGTRELIEQASKDSYDSPEDGRLTESQIEMYLKVREAEKKYAQVARKELEERAAKIKEKGESVSGMIEAFKGLGSVADFATADIRAAQELGYNTAEYMWVKGQVLEASAAAATEGFREAGNASLNKMRKQIQDQHDNATDPVVKEQLGKLLEQYEQQAESVEPEEEDSVTYNRKLLSKYENVLNALAQEWSKYEENEGDAEEAMQNIEEQNKKAVAAAEDPGQ